MLVGDGDAADMEPGGRFVVDDADSDDDDDDDVEFMRRLFVFSSGRFVPLIL
jgi:hypothetical protein